MPHILYVGWLGYGNLGDELLWDVFHSLCCEFLDMTKFKITASFRHVDLNDLSPYDLVVLGGGSLILPYYADVLRRAARAKKKVAIWGSGLDWQPKEYVDVLRNKEASSFTPFGSEFAESLAEVVRQSTYTGVRGPLTYAAMERMGIPLDAVTHSGDPGLLVTETTAEHGTYPATGKLRQEEEKVIGVNWGTTYNKIYGTSELDVEEQLVQALRALIKQGYKVVLYDVWHEDVECSKRLFEEIGDTAHVHRMEKLFNQHELIRMVKELTFTLNFKLHANVLSFVAGTPFIALGYRFKVFDFADSVDMSNAVVATDSPTLAEDILTCAEYVSQTREETVQKFKRYRAKCRTELERPFRSQWNM